MRELAELVRAMREAIDLERAAVCEALGTEAALPARIGALHPSAGGRARVDVEVEAPALIPDGTRITLFVRARPIGGEVVHHQPDGGVLCCELSAAPDPGGGDATLTFQAAGLLESLSDRLLELAGAEPAAARRVLDFLRGTAAPPADVPTPLVAGLTASQRRALGLGLSAGAAYVWGPPGTGKTRVVAQLASELVRRGERVLIAAHTNAAVDGAVAALRAIAPGLACARLGAEGAGAAGAPVVAATLCRLYASGALREVAFDAVLVDEASMAPLPSLALAALRARARIVAFGDPRQLPAIVQSEHPQARLWLGRSVFDTANVGGEEDGPLSVMLEEQWRMHPAICDVVSSVFYGGRLATAPARLDGAHPARAVALLDTASRGARSRKPSGGSKANGVHAEVVVDLIEACPRKVAVITPYRAQVAEIRAALQRRCPDRLSDGSVEVATVHRFQGRDEEVVILDTTDGPDTSSWMLDERQNADAPRLLNVALSRARDTLVVIANLDFLERQHGSVGLLAEVFAAIRAAGAELDAGDPGDRPAIEAILRRGAG